MHQPGIEPGSRTWQAPILTIVLLMLNLLLIESLLTLTTKYTVNEFIISVLKEILKFKLK
jgi:hypothetical protein